MQDERKNLYEKLQKSAPQPGSETTEEEVQETSGAPQDDRHVQSAAAPTGASTPDTPLARELVKLKAEQARLKEIASSFTVSHVLPTETVPSHSQQLQDTEGNCTEVVQEDEEEGFQKQRELEMESVD